MYRVQHRQRRNIENLALLKVMFDQLFVQKQIEVIRGKVKRVGSLRERFLDRTGSNYGSGSTATTLLGLG